MAGENIYYPDYAYDAMKFAPHAYVRKAGPHIGHRQHLCDMVDRGDVSLNQFKELVKDAKFICRVCGRAAAKESNLCEPIPID